MADTTSSSSEEDAPAQRRRRMNADRGVVKRETWTAPSESESGSDSDSETEPESAHDRDSDDSDYVPLAQREEAGDDSGEETEEDAAIVKRGLRNPLSHERIARVKTEVASSVDSSEGSDDDGDKSGDDGEISVKSEREVHSDRGADAMARNHRRTAQAAEDTESEVDEMDDAGSEVDAIASGTRQATGRRANDDTGESTEDEDDLKRIAKPRKNRMRATLANQAADDDEEEAEDEDADDEDTDAEEEDDEEADEETEDEVDDLQAPTKKDADAAKHLMDRFIHAKLSFTERAALHQGKPIVGPPIDRTISQADQWKRKYRWPVALRNVRRRRYIADAKELATDHELRLVDEPRSSSSVSDTARIAFAAALAPTARPLMSAAIATFREQSDKRQREMGFVERLEETKESDRDHEAIDATRLRALSRLGGHFTDQLLDSILVKNVLALQGIDASYAQQCWDPLPTSKRPVANWRFVLEHFCRTSTHGVDAMAISAAPRLRKDTLIRVRDRLRTLYGVAWRPEDDAFFDLVDQQEIDPPEPSELVQF